MTAVQEVRSFNELMDSRGMLGETPYRWARALYKYTDCGPWTVFLMADQREVYYESEEVNSIDPKDIIGIKLGSIVEGSDVEIDPVSIRFPFDPEEIDRILNAINEEAKFYWDRDNSDWFYVSSPQGKTYGVKNTWGDITWEGKPRNKEVIAVIEKMVGEDLWVDDPNHPGCLIRPNFPKDDSTAELPGHKGWTVTSYLNDCIY